MFEQRWRVVTAFVISVTAVTGFLAAQDTTTRKDTAAVPAVLATPPAPTIEQLRYQDGLRTATRGITQLRDGLSRVAVSANARLIQNSAKRDHIGPLRGKASMPDGAITGMRNRF